MERILSIVAAYLTSLKQQKKKHVSILLVMCHLSVPKTRHSNVTQNGNVITMFLGYAKISISFVVQLAKLPRDSILYQL